MEKPKYFLIDGAIVESLKAILGDMPFKQVGGVMAGGIDNRTGQPVRGLLNLQPAPEPVAAPAEKPNGAPQAEQTAEPSAN